MKSVAQVLGVVARIALWGAAIGLTLMTVFIAWQVFGRYVLNSTPIWTEQTSVLLMGWFIFLGAAVGIREGYHLSFDILIHVIPKKLKLTFFTISDAFVIAFSVGMVVYGSQLVIGTWSATTPSLGIPGGIDYLSLVCGGVLMAIFSLERIARRAAGLPTARFGETDLFDEE
ncbi:TRAP transporter small permease [Martelella radicis]|uniref:TRAP transporter small permease protein n=1 Tax=Martelella radicis TaxID=1397476 RepID=A0A7W6KGY8_9HYPH|nr:TRAP transporter small permease [Martelella radicis]MBB4120887.1 TRAP-type C4-dicarboxylate transport system permease small subunit [Martelella radicis]